MRAISTRTLRPEADRSRYSSDIVVAGETAYVFGVLPLDLDNDRTPLAEYIEEQTKQVLDNLGKILASCGLGRDDVIAVRIYLRDYDRLHERMERAYTGFFSSGHLPTRSCIGVQALPREALVQMDFVVRAPTGATQEQR